MAGVKARVGAQKMQKAPGQQAAQGKQKHG
jgi:hypothetical protein